MACHHKLGLWKSHTFNTQSSSTHAYWWPCDWNHKSTNFVYGLYCYICWWYRLHCMLSCSLGGLDQNILEIWCTIMCSSCIYTSNRLWCEHNGVGLYTPLSNTTFVCLMILKYQGISIWKKKTLLWVEPQANMSKGRSNPIIAMKSFILFV